MGTFPSASFPAMHSALLCGFLDPDRAHSFAFTFPSQTMALGLLAVYRRNQKSPYGGG